MDNRTTTYNGINIYSVTSDNGTYFYYENSTGLLIINECIKMNIQPTEKVVEVSYRKYYIKPENRVAVEADFPNQLPKDLINASQKVEFTTSYFTVGSVLYTLLFPTYSGLFKHALNGKISSEPDFVAGADLINRNGIEIYDTAGVYKSPVDVSVISTDETIALSDGTIAVTIANDWDTNNFEISKDNGVTFQNVTTDFTSLIPGTYTLVARHKVDLKNSIPQVITINPYVA